MSKHRLLLPLTLLATALVAHPGTAARRPGSSAAPLFDYGGFWFSSGPEEFSSEFTLDVTSTTPGPKGTSFEAQFADVVLHGEVKGKVTNKGKISWEGKLISGLIKEGVGPQGFPDATATIKFTGQIANDGTLATGTFKTTFKNLNEAPESPFKIQGGWLMDTNL